MMHTWTSRPGYPVIKAELVNGQMEISQSRFFSSPASKAKAKDKTKWEVPIIFGEDKVNLGETGFFRTAYSKELLEKLVTGVENKTLSAPDRLGIVRDLFALSEAGVIPTTDALEFLPAYKNEDNYTVLVEIASGLARIEQLIAKEKWADSLNPLVIKIFSGALARLGWEKRDGEPHTDSLLRSLAISRLGRSGDKKVITEARKKFAMIKKGIHVNPDIRGAIYGVVATHGNAKDHKDMVAMYKKETLHEEKNRLGSALGDFKEDKVLCATVEFAMSEHVRIQDSVSILSSVGANPYGRNIWLKHIKYNWKTLISRYGDGGMALSRVVKAIASSAEEKHFKAYKEFFAKNEAPGAKRSVDQVLERLEGNILWLKRDKKTIEKFLKNN